MRDVDAGTTEVLAEALPERVVANATYHERSGAMAGGFDRLGATLAAALYRE